MKAEGTALVTGASRGIGRAVTLELARRGFDVVASMRDPAAGSGLPASLEAGSIRVSTLDVTRPESIEIPDGLRVLVNNAGIEGPYLPVENAPMELWRDMFETNVFGLVEVTRRAIPVLRANRGGVLCNITSCSTLLPVPFFAAYRASKAAVSAIGESLRTELAPFGIRILDIQPGAIDTDMLAGSQRPPEAIGCDGYQTLGEQVLATRQASKEQFTPADEAARAIADAILDDQTPLRFGCDPMGAGILEAWRNSDDETMMGGMLKLFAPPEAPEDAS
ncbi:MAG: SDR family NAD(P)-dependent oxidoreductase [Myxococcota bacterium]